MLKWIKQKLNRPPALEAKPAETLPVVVAAASLGISLDLISLNARKVMQGLHHQGYAATLVGGGIRDMLVGRRPKDFDIATSAHPEQVRDLFRHSRLIGRRFRLVHVYFGQEMVEVATFRGHNGAEPITSADGMVLRDNVYGDMESDAWRRDFTVNALYYNFADQTIIDYTGGLADLRQQRLTLIGEPEQRFREDPVRMIRAVRFAAKIGFQIEPRCEAAIATMGQLLTAVSSSRLFDEVNKLFLTGHGLASFRLLRRYQLLTRLYPFLTEAHLADPLRVQFIETALANSDERIAAGKAVTAGFLLAILLWSEVKRRADVSGLEGGGYLHALQQGGSALFSEQQKITSGPHHFMHMASDIWLLQQRLLMGRHPYKLLENARFRAAYDFLELRVRAGEEALTAWYEWWSAFQQQSRAGRAEMADALQQAHGATLAKRRPRRRGPGRRGSQADRLNETSNE